MDCFYCQVESRLDPTLKGKPMAVVQYNTWKGGGIIAVNYEARAFGVTRQMRGDEAKKKCEDIILIKVPEVRGKADLTKYRDAGKEVIEVLLEFGSIVERASIDEAYLDLSELVENELQELVSNQIKINTNDLPNTYVVGYNAEGKTPASWFEFVQSDNNADIDNLRLLIGAKIVENMRASIFDKTQFRCSAGIAHNKMLSKFSCGINKPNKQTILPQDQVADLFKSVPICKLRGLGGKLGADVSIKLNCEYVSDLASLPLNVIRSSYDDKTSQWLHNISRGIDTEDVKDRDLPKSIGCGKNFRGPEILSSRQKVEYWMKQLCEELAIRLNKDRENNKRVARGLTVSVNQEGFGHRTLSGPLFSYETDKIVRQAMELIAKLNQSKEKELWRPKLLNLSISTSKFTEPSTLEKSNSVASYFSGSTTNHQISPFEEGASKRSNGDDLAKELFPSLWDELPSLDYDETLLESLPSKIKAKVECRINILKERNFSIDRLEIDHEIQEKNKVEDLKEMKDKSNGIILETSGSSNVESIEQINNENSSNMSDYTSEDTTKCPKCIMQISPFDLPEHLDMHLAKEIHRKIQDDLKKSSELSRNEAKRNDESRKRKVTQTDSVTRDSKKQTDIKNYFFKR